MSASHPLIALFDAVGRGVYPPVDLRTEVMPPPPGPARAAVLAFTGHHIVAAGIEPEWIFSHCPADDLTAPLSPRFLQALAERTGSSPGLIDVVLLTHGEVGEPEIALRPADLAAGHPRVERARRYRRDIEIFETLDGSGLLILGRGLAGRREAAFEVRPGARNRGLGRALVAASRRLIPAGEPLFMQVAPGNTASLRAVLAAGLIPIGAECLFI